MKFLSIATGLSLLSAAFIAPRLNPDTGLKAALQHLETAVQQHTDTQQLPRSTQNGALRTVKSADWTSGFFPGNLWYAYEYTNDPKWKAQAERWTEALEKEQYNTRTHDLGFMLFCSYGNGYRLTQNPKYRAVLIQGAKSLSTRFRPRTGTIRSWDHNRDKWQFPVIIDNMMNLELLFWATKATGDPSFRNVAITHANTTMKNHFRPDGSSYHVVDYDTTTGAVRSRVTHQGAADESAWARGQAWGLYGYTVMYRETKDKKYLDLAQKIADFILNHKNLPADKVPYWDFDRPGEERDASAASITASALLELSQYSGKKGKTYSEAAEHMLQSLSNSYVAAPNTNANFVLLHSVGHKPAKSEIDVPLVYADYYFMEGLLRYKNGIKVVSR